MVEQKKLNQNFNQQKNPSYFLIVFLIALIICGGIVYLISKIDRKFPSQEPVQETAISQKTMDDLTSPSTEEIEVPAEIIDKVTAPGQNQAAQKEAQDILEGIIDQLTPQ